METASSSASPVPQPQPIPRHRKIGSNYFLEYSIKEDRYVEFESSIEYRVWLYMECNPGISRLVEQAPRIEKVINGKHFLYTFDLWIRQSDNVEKCIEIKPESKLIPNKAGALKPRNWDLVEPISEELGLNIAVITDQFVESRQQYLDNLFQIYPFIKEAHIENDISLRKSIIHYASQVGGISLNKLETYFPDIPRQQVYQAAFYSIYLGDLVADLDSTAVGADLVLEVPDDKS